MLCVEEGDEPPVFCCDHRQITDLAVSFGQALSLVGRCPSCARNLRMVFCSLTCDPHHSAFLSANATIEHQSEETGENVTLITALNYHISESYVQGLYESCSEVVNPSSNSLALPTFCGSWGEDCNAHRLLDAMGLGADHGGFSPFDIYFDYVTDDQPPSTEFEPFNPVAVACYQPISVSYTLLPFASLRSSVLTLFSIKTEYKRDVLLRRLHWKLP